MSKPILYGSDMSPPVRTVLLTAYAIGLDFDFKEVSAMKGETQTEEFIRKNPQHTIPTLEDGGKIIWDSHAIASYLVGKYAKDDSLYPKDLYTRAMINQRLHFESGVLSAKIHTVVGRMKHNDLEGMNKAKEVLEEVYDFLEKFLTNGTYMVGNSPTIADFSIVSQLSTINLALPVDPQKFSKLVEWMKRMETLPYYEKGNGEGLKVIAVIIEKMMAGEM